MQICLACRNVAPCAMEEVWRIMNSGMRIDLLGNHTLLSSVYCYNYEFFQSDPSSPLFKSAKSLVEVQRSDVRSISKFCIFVVLQGLISFVYFYLFFFFFLFSYSSMPFTMAMMNTNAVCSWFTPAITHFPDRIKWFSRAAKVRLSFICSLLPVLSRPRPLRGPKENNSTMAYGLFFLFLNFTFNV